MCAQVLWCQCLARELSRELATNPLKEVPGFTGADLRALGYCVASASCLSVLWVAAGLATRQFEPTDSYGEGLRRVVHRRGQRAGLRPAPAQRRRALAAAEPPPVSM